MTLFVGSDGSKYKHDLAILNEHGEILSKHFQFTNTHQGFQRLKKHLEDLELPTSELHIALEDTGITPITSLLFYDNWVTLSSLTMPYSSKNLSNLCPYEKLRQTRKMRSQLLISLGWM